MKKNDTLEFLLLEDIENETFVKFYKFLFSDLFKSISNDSKILYSIIRDIMSASKKNGWIDEDGRVFCYVTNKKICNMLNISDKTATKVKNELIDFGLLYQKRQRNKPTKYYLKKPKNRNRKSYESKELGIVKVTTLESEKLRTNKTKYNKTKFNLHFSEKNDDYVFFKNIKDGDIIKQINNSLNTGRKKIQSKNYQKVYLDVVEFLELNSIDDLNKKIKEYIINKEEGISVENFVYTLKR